MLNLIPWLISDYNERGLVVLDYLLLKQIYMKIINKIIAKVYNDSVFQIHHQYSYTLKFLLSSLTFNTHPLYNHI